MAEEKDVVERAVDEISSDVKLLIRYVVIVSLAFIIIQNLLSFLDKTFVLVQRVRAELSPLEGEITADGSEQTLVEVTDAAPFKFSGWVSLSNMQDGDQVKITSYVKLCPDCGWEVFESNVYSDSQDKPAVYHVEVTGKYGVKVTLQQTAGAYRSFKYLFFVEK